MRCLQECRRSKVVKIVFEHDESKAFQKDLQFKLPMKRHPQTLYPFRIKTLSYYKFLPCRCKETQAVQDAAITRSELHMILGSNSKFILIMLPVLSVRGEH